MDDKLCVYCQVAESIGYPNLRRYGKPLPCPPGMNSSGYIEQGGGVPPAFSGRGVCVLIHYCPMCGRKLDTP